MPDDDGLDYFGVDLDSPEYCSPTPRSPDGPTPTKPITLASRRQCRITNLPVAHSTPPAAALLPPSVLGGFSCAGMQPGNRPDADPEIKPNQDIGLVAVAGGGLLMCVVDGHGSFGGPLAAYAALTLHHQLEDLDPSHLTRAYLHTDQQMAAHYAELVKASGCTAVCVWLRNNSLWTANCGRSRAVLATATSAGSLVSSIRLSRDHVPGDSSERARLEGAGGGYCSLASHCCLSALSLLSLDLIRLQPSSRFCSLVTERLLRCSLVTCRDCGHREQCKWHSMEPHSYTWTWSGKVLRR